MRFKTKDGTTKYIALLSGHCANVYPQFAELDEMFHANAYAMGCVSEDQIFVEERSALSDTGRKEFINAAFAEVVSRNNPEDWTKPDIKTGETKPKLEAIERICGFKVTPRERAEALAILDTIGHRATPKTAAADGE